MAPKVSASPRRFRARPRSWPRSAPRPGRSSTACRCAPTTSSSVLRTGRAGESHLATIRAARCVPRRAMPSSPPDDARRIFKGIGATYERAGAVLSFGQDARWRARLVDSVGAASGDVVLDVATGTGLVARAVSERYGCEVVGLDRSSDMLSTAAARDGHIPLVRARAE